MSELRLLWWNVDWQRTRFSDRQIDAVLELEPAPGVVALCELDAGRTAEWRRTLRKAGYKFVRAPNDLRSRDLRVVLASRLPMRPLRARRFSGIWPRAMRSARVSVDGREIDVHAVHVPNGSANGWIKIDHLRALRNGFERPHRRPQILCGDFNTPQSEIGGRLITFGQTLSGRLRARPTSTVPFTADRPWDPEVWDRGERAVLEGLPQKCDMPDIFRVCHPDAIDATWIPRGLPEERGRRLDHVFASTELEPISCRHIHEWRHAGVSDHSAIETVFRVSHQPRRRS